MSSVPGYDSLSNVLGAAYHQAARGKGKERHARDKPFDKQPIMEISRMVGPGYATGQAMKKLQEAKSMMDRGQLAAAKAEALGAAIQRVRKEREHGKTTDRQVAGAGGISGPHE